MPQTWFTSDLHFGHEKVSVLRGFGSQSTTKIEHDSMILWNWYKTVHRDDVVYILGDISAGGRAATERALYFLNDLPGRKRLIAGNHDPIHPMNRDAHKWVSKFGDVFEFVAPFARIKVYGQDVMLSHFPYERDRDKVRYLQYRLRDEGLPLLHGHTHGTEIVTSRMDGSDREIHVGVDAHNLAPVNLEQIREYLG